MGSNKIDSTDLIDIGDFDDLPEEDVTEGREDKTLPSNILGNSNREVDTTPTLSEIKDRFAALFIDFACLYVLYWFVLIIYRTIALNTAAGPIPARGIHGIVFHSIFLFIALFWFVLPEFVFQGSFGKLLTNLRVKMIDGREPTFLSALIRNLFKPVDALLFPFLILSGFLEWSSLRRRLGDFLARTIVIKKFSSTPKLFALTGQIISSSTRRAIAFLIDLAIMAAFVGGYLLLLTPEKTSI